MKTTTTTFYTGDVVWVTDTLTNKGRRPHLIITMKGGIGVVPLTHTQQGRWTTNELGGGTYIAARNQRTGELNTLWVTADQCELYRKQLRDETITAALKEVARQIA